MTDKEKKPCELASHSASDNGVVADTLQTQYNINLKSLEDLSCEVNGKKGDKKSMNRSFAGRKLYCAPLSSSMARLSLEFGRLRDEGLSVEEIGEQYQLLPSLGPRSQRVSDCASYLEFRKALGTEEGFKLHKANFCRDRMCPVCSHRRSLKTFSQMSSVLNNITVSDYCPLFLTLTVPNCEGYALKEVSERLLKAFTSLMRRKELKCCVEGYARAFEVTFNHNKMSKSYMTFHPHMHVILLVKRSYFKKHYIPHDKWLQMWRECYGDGSIEILDIRRIKYKGSELEDAAALMSEEIKLNAAVREVSKYSVKSSDYIFPRNEDMTDYAVRYISYALNGIRLFALGGVFADVSKKLNQEDVMSAGADLIHLSEDDKVNPELSYVVVRFGWGGSLYKPSDMYVLNSSKEN